MDRHGEERNRPTQPPSTTMTPEDFERLVDGHIALLTSVAVRLLRDVTEAETLVQTTLTKVLRQQQGGCAETAIKGCLLTTLRNTFIEQYGKGKKRPALS